MSQSLPDNGDPDAVLDAILDEEAPPAPPWVLAAAAEQDLADLASVARTQSPLPGVPALAGLRALELCDPAALAEAGHGRAVLDGIVAAQRIIARVQALQQRWIAAFARPGVAVPLDDVIEAASTSLAEKFGALPPATADGETDVPATLAHPLWHGAIIDTASRFAAAEIACATHLAPITARMRLERAGMMVETLPATLAAQQAGHLDGYRASIIADGVTALPAALRPRVERSVLASASACTASELRRRVARAVIAADPAGAADRAARAAKSRHTSLAAIENDMALFRAVLPAPDAVMVHGVLDSVAASLTASGRAGGRGSGQLRADVLTDLFRTLATTGHAHIAVRDSSDPAGDAPVAPGTTPVAPGTTSPTSDRPTAKDAGTGIASCRCGGRSTGVRPDCSAPESDPRPDGRTPGSDVRPDGRAPGPTDASCSCSRDSVRSAPKVSLSVHLDLATLAGMADHPGEIGGYGIVTADTARALAASADSIRAMVHHPVSAGMHSDNAVRSRACGTIVDLGRAVYRPPEATADHVRARDQHCQFPGCRVRAERCDIDHRVPYQQGGATCPCNLDLLCRAHHRLKTFTPWRSVPDAAGRLTWISPLGHTYALTPEPTRSAARAGDPPGRHSSVPPRSAADDPPPF